MMLVTLVLPANAGDLLRGGARTNSAGRGAGPGGTAGAGAAAAARADLTARDRLSRTTQAINSVRALQAAARAAAGGRPSTPGNPAQPVTRLPRVTDGLSTNGLKLAAGVPRDLLKPGKGENAALWTGAKLPTQTTGKDGVQVTIVQTDQQAVLNWEKFNVGEKTTLTFDQSAGGSDASKWIAFNKVNDPTGRPSQILGSIKAEGQVYVINRNGIIFGGKSQVNAHTLTAAALPINDALISGGLLNNPTGQFLLNASRTQDLLGQLTATARSVVLADQLDARSQPLLTATVLKTDGTTKSVTFRPGRDYTLATDGKKQTTLTLTDAGVAKLGTAPTAVSVSYQGRAGDVIVERGARLAAPTSPEKVGGRIFLAGANVANAGTLATPDGQTILAAGLQVGISAHPSDDPSIRGLDVFVGQVGDQREGAKPFAGLATNTGLIEIERANLTMTGRRLRQDGVVDGLTTVARNTSVVLDATYDVLSNPLYDPESTIQGRDVLFIPQSSGVVSLGRGSITRLLPDFTSDETLAAETLTLRSQLSARGRAIHFDENSTLLAPNGLVTARAGIWNLTPSANSSSPPISDFVHSAGQIFVDRGALIDVSGTTNTLVSQAQSILQVELRGAELADSPVQREGALRGVELTVDVRKTGTYNGREWVGTPLGDTRGFVDLIQRNVAQLTRAGGSLDFQAGDAFVLAAGATLDVSGGYVRNEGGYVRTTKLTQGSRLIPIEQATPDQVYDGIYDPKFVRTQAKWGLSETYRHPLALLGGTYESESLAGADGGSIAISAPSMALDGQMLGRTITGPRQLRRDELTTAGPKSSALTLKFRRQEIDPEYGPAFSYSAPTPPRIVFSSFRPEVTAPVYNARTPGGGDVSLLPADRRREVVLSPALLTDAGFGRIDIENFGGDFELPAAESLDLPALGTLTLKGRNLRILGDITAPGGRIALTANNLSPYLVEGLKLSAGFIAPEDLPVVDPRAGRLLVGSGARISTAGLVLDERNAGPVLPAKIDGGRITLTAFTARLAAGSTVDVSGGVFVTRGSDIHYGDAGAISVLAGKDSNLATLFPASAYEGDRAERLPAGRITLDGELLGYSGAAGGSLALQAPFIRVGLDGGEPGTLHLDSAFFDRGGFAAFDLTGIGGSRNTLAGRRRILPGVVISGEIAPRIRNLFAELLGGPAGTLEIRRTLRPAGEREGISLGFHSLGFKDPIRTTEQPLGLGARGDLVVNADAVLRSEAGATLAFTGTTVTFLGAAIAPAGAITIRGSTDSVETFNQVPGSEQVLPTVYLGPNSRLEAAGTTLLTPNVYGARTGTVLAGGSIDVEGNLVAAAGSRLDVSGTRAALDFTPAELDPAVSLAIPVNSGLTAPLATRRFIRAMVESDGGSITLGGGELLLVDSTLEGRAGGRSALGGSLSVSAQRFLGVNTPLDIQLVVTQSGQLVPGTLADVPADRVVGRRLVRGNGREIAGLGYFAADRFLEGGFASLELAGTVAFRGPVDLTAAASLRVADGGVLWAADRVSLTAPYVALGTALETPVLTGKREAPFFSGTNPLNFAPVTGEGELLVRARHIDIGNLSLRRIGFALLEADQGDIRGAGTFNLAGNLVLRAGQIYPTSANRFTVVAYDYRGADFQPGDKLQPSSIRVEAAGARNLPLSAGGELNLYASRIAQDGVLRAPLGTINLGWDGTGPQPTDLIAGDTAPFPVTSQLRLGAGSLTSVSAVDSRTNVGVIIPYGVSLDGNSWIDPGGNDITRTGQPTKNLTLSATNIVSRPGSTLDLRGGGDLYAYQWIAGNGGTQDVLAAEGRFAVLPGYDSVLTPRADFNADSAATNLRTDPADETTAVRGYVNDSLAPGDRVYLGASEGLAAGFYTLLPARYALLPGAFLVTPQSGTPLGTLAQPDGSTLVSGYRVNALGGDRPQTVLSRFEVAGSSVFRQRATYVDFLASDYLATRAAEAGNARPVLPLDSGRLGLVATRTIDLRGAVLGRSTVAGGRGAFVDISSAADILIGSLADLRQPRPKNTLVLSAGLLSSWQAESLLIGGLRRAGETGTVIDVRTARVTLANGAETLTGPEILLAATDAITLGRGATITQTGRLTNAGESLTIDGDGAFVRATSDETARFERTGTTATGTARLDVGAGVALTGRSFTLDSSNDTRLSPNARLAADYLALNSGRIGIQLDPRVTVPKDAGLLLSGAALAGLRGIDGLSLLSYGAFDIYGGGRFNVGGALTISTGQIRAFSPGDRAAEFTANTIRLENRAASVDPAPVGTPQGTLRFSADTLTLGRGRVAIDGYDRVELEGRRGLLLEDNGSLVAQRDLAIRTALITSEPSAKKTLVAGGAFTVADSGEAPAAGLPAGLGASLSLRGASLTVDSDITLPSGLLSLRATQGDVVVRGRLDVNGTAQVFNDVIRTTNGGEISLIADRGDVRLTRAGQLSLAGPALGGNAGLLRVEAVNGAVDLRGRVLATPGEAGLGGSFSADVKDLANYDALNQRLNRGQFTETRSLRVREGDVIIDGTTTARRFLLSADAGSILVRGRIDASGATGGSIWLVAGQDLTLASGADLTVAGRDFDAAGKGGSITLETARGSLDLRDGSTLDLSVASERPDSASFGRFSGRLHLRAPQTTAGTDLAINAIDSRIVGASSIVLEGFRTFDLSLVGGLISNSGTIFQPAGGLITNAGVNVQQSIRLAGETFGDATAAIKGRLFAAGSPLLDRLVVAPGAEIINGATNAPIPVSLGTAGGSSIVVPSQGGTLQFPDGTAGNNQISVTRASTILHADGTTTALAANTPTSLAPGSSVVLTTGATVNFAAGGTGGAIAVRLTPGTTFTTGGAASGAVTTRGAIATLNTPGTSGVSLTAGSSVLFTAGTPGTRRITSSVPATIVTAAGVTINLAANTPTTIAAGSTLTLSAAGQLTYATGGSGSGTAPTLSLLAGSFTTTGAVALSSSSGDLTLGTFADNDANNWDLSTFRFGPNDAPGILTLRAAGNLVFLNGLSDGFKSAAYNAELLAPNTALPRNVQSWSYRFAAGADLTAADFRQVRSVGRLAANSGSLLLGKSYRNTFNSGASATLAAAILNRYQVIRTGTGDITIAAGRDVQMRNVFATIYTAGTRVDDATLGGTFDLPVTIPSDQGNDLGVVQQSPGYAAQYSYAGGNIDIRAGADITTNILVTVAGRPVADSKRQLPNNWLYRRGYIDPATGKFGITPLIRSEAGGFNGGDVNSTSWWVDFSNFFEGVGALGGGHVNLAAGRDVSNVDAVTPTNARLPKTAARADALVELGGGDVTVRAGRDIDAGVYYVERGQGTLVAGNEIRTNASRSASLTAFQNVTENFTPAETSWLPTTLFLGKGRFDVSARGDVLLGPTANLFLLPQGLNNSIWYRTIFSTYAPDSAVNAFSLGGTVTLRTGVSLPTGSGAANSVLLAWIRTQQRFRGTDSNATSAAFYQPWLRLNEIEVGTFASAVDLLPGTLRLTAFSDDINLVGDLTLSPAPRGTLELIAGGALNGVQPSGSVLAGTNRLVTWAASRINVSDASPAAIPQVTTPYSYREYAGSQANTPNGARKPADSNYLRDFNRLFEETGSTDVTSETKQALHAPGVLHANDPDPVRIFAQDGDISGLTLFSPKAARIVAGGDITDIAFYLQNVRADDVSVVAAGGDLIAYNANSPLRTLARAAGNLPPGLTTVSDDSFAGDIQIAGPGSLVVLAGGTLDLGTGLAREDGTGTGITSIGLARNPNLPAEGAALLVGAGIGPAAGLDASELDFDGFLEQSLTDETLGGYLQEIEPDLTADDFANLPRARRDALALQVFFHVLRDAGRSETGTIPGGGYADGFAAIDALFPTSAGEDGRAFRGDILTRARDIRTKAGGGISLFLPHGGLTLASSSLGNPLVPPGIISENGGDVSIFTRDDVDLGIGRIFTLKGGDIVIWSSEGDIAAGAAAKTVKSAPPTRALFDIQSADVTTDLAGLSTGGGIGVLATVEGVPPGDVDLIAPVGVVDAGDAGIRVSGNLNIAATAVLNASNINVAGTTSGVPAAPVVAAPNIAGLTSASSTTGATNAAANQLANQAQPRPSADETPSVIEVEVLGYGGGEDSASL